MKHKCNVKHYETPLEMKRINKNNNEIVLEHLHMKNK